MKNINKRYLSKFCKEIGKCAGYLSVYIAIVSIATIGIKGFADSININRWMIADAQKKIQGLSLRMAEELARVKEIKEFQELEKLMQNILNTTKRDRAFSNFLGRFQLDFQSYKSYCDLYLKGNFESFPFAYDHYDIAYSECAVWVDNSYYDADGRFIDSGYWGTETYSYYVFDYREYFEVNGSMDKAKAEYYNMLYDERAKFLSQYDNLSLEKANLKNSINSNTQSIAIKIFFIVLVTLTAIVAMTIFAVTTNQEFKKNAHSVKENFNKLFLVDKVENAQNMEKIYDALSSA